jgi:hypothetical protein
MGRHLTLDEYLKAFTDEETESVQEAISVRVSDAEVHSLGLLFIHLMGGVLQSLRHSPRKRVWRALLASSKHPGSSDRLIIEFVDEVNEEDEDLIH